MVGTFVVSTFLAEITNLVEVVLVRCALFVGQSDEFLCGTIVPCHVMQGTPEDVNIDVGVVLLIDDDVGLGLESPRWSMLLVV